MTRDALLSALERRRDEAAAMYATAPVASVLEVVIAELRTIEAPANGNGGEPAPDRMLRAEEVAERLNLSRSAVYAMARKGGWPWVRRLPSGSVRFSERGLERWLARQR